MTIVYGDGNKNTADAPTMPDNTKKKFKIKLFNGKDPQAQYDAVEVKDDHTLYILDIPGGYGKGYLGEHIMWEKGTLTAPPDSSVVPVDTIGRKEVVLLDTEVTNTQANIKLLDDPSQFDELKVFLQVSVNNELTYIYNLVEMSDFIQERTMTILNGTLKWNIDTESLTVTLNSVSTHILKIVGIKYQETKVGRKIYELTDEGGITLNPKQTGDIAQLTDDLCNYDTFYAEYYYGVNNNCYPLPETSSKHTGDYTCIVWPSLISLGIKDDQRTVFCTENVSSQVITLKLYGIKYETTSVEPASLTKLITSIVNEQLEKYVEYEVDDGTAPEDTATTDTTGNNEPTWGQIIDK